MNERTKELAIQAKIQMVSEPRLDEFAKLIVQECIDIISPYTVRMERAGEEHLHPILEIKKRFGVE